MPPVIVAVAAYVGSAYIAGAAVAAGWSAFAVAAVKFGVAYAISAIGSKLTGQRNTATASSQARRETIRQAAANRRVIYGEMRSGGVLVYATTDGTDNKFCHQVLVVSHGEVDSIGPAAWLNNDPVTTERFSGLWSMEVFRGNAGQGVLVIPGHTDEWTPDHKLEGVAFVYLKLEYDVVAFPSGLPSASFMVRGRRLWDPRTNTTTWSANSALCVLDYLRADFGLNAPLDLIDVDSFIAAANVCDELVESLYGNIKRYSCNGIVNLDGSPASIIEALQSSCAGHLVFSGGKYRFYAGAYDSSVVTITEEWLRGDPVIRVAPSRKDLFNTVRGLNVEKRADFHDYDYYSQVDEVGLAQDGEEIVSNVDFPFTTDSSTAQRLARLALNKGRGGKSLRLPCNWAALQLKLWDVVAVEIRGAPSMLTTFRITEFALAEGGGIDLTLQEERATDYAWTVEMEQPIPEADVPVVPAELTMRTFQLVSPDQAWPETSTEQGHMMAAWDADEAAIGYHVSRAVLVGDSWVTMVEFYGAGGIYYDVGAALEYQMAFTATTENAYGATVESATYGVGVRAVYDDVEVPLGSWHILVAGPVHGQVKDVAATLTNTGGYDRELTVDWDVQPAFAALGYDRFEIRVNAGGNSSSTLHTVVGVDERTVTLTNPDYSGEFDHILFVEVYIRALRGEAGQPGTVYGKWETVTSNSLPYPE